MIHRLPARRALWLVASLSFSILLAACSASLAATPLEAPYYSYIYDFWSYMVPAPQAYLPDRVYDGDALGVGPLKDPLDLFVSADRHVYLADTGNNRIICMDSNYRVTKVISGFVNNGVQDKFNKPEGVFVTAAGEIYVADTVNGRVVVLDREGNLLRIVGPPELSDGYEGIVSEDFVYRPRKVAVSPTREMYVIARDVFDGLMKYNAGGNFSGFIGAPRVAPTLWERFWAWIATDEQRERKALFLPIEYVNIDIDSKGMIMAVEQGTSKKESVKRLNPAGEDVLVRAGFLPPMGDPADRSTGISVFADIVAREFGTYTVLDRQYGRIFTYDSLGNLLYVFGGLGDSVGLFRLPTAIDTLGSDVVVLDSSGSFTVFKPTEYGKLITAALALYNSGRYEEATEYWKKVLRLNANYDMAYSGIGSALFRQGDYIGAMTNFRLGQNRAGYSEAFAVYRREVVGQHFGTFATVVAIVIVLIWVFARARARASSRLEPADSTAAGIYGAYSAQPHAFHYQVEHRNLLMKDKIRETLRALRFAFHVLAHPFDGFWELKHEKRGNLAAANVILLFVVATLIFMRQYTGFVLNKNDLWQLNVITEALGVVVPFILWCAVNWALTTLMEGKGTFREIVIASAYSLLPLILVIVPLTLVSHFLVLEEAQIYYLILVLSMIWAGLMLFIGTMITHEYSFAKTIGTSVLVVAGIGVSLFIMLLFSTVINHMIVFAIDIYSEAVLR